MKYTYKYRKYGMRRLSAADTAAGSRPCTIALCITTKEREGAGADLLENTTNPTVSINRTRRRPHAPHWSRAGTDAIGGARCRELCSDGAQSWMLCVLLSYPSSSTAQCRPGEKRLERTQ